MATAPTTTFHWADYLVFTITLVISLSIGLYYAFAGGKQRTTKEYLMGNRNLATIPAAVSMFLSYTSAVLVLGMSAEMYTQGTQLWVGAVGSVLAAILSTLLFVPLFWPLKITSSFTYLEKRFKKPAVKHVATALLVLSQIFYLGIAMFSPATALEAVTPIPVWASIIATGLVATIYTTLGGIKAVIWTDVFQAIVMLGGLILVLVLGSNAAGGLGNVWRIARENGRIRFFDMDPNPTIRTTFWSVIVGRMIANLHELGTVQTSVQRYCAVPTMTRGRIAVLMNIPPLLISFSLVCLVGLVVFAYYSRIGCDPLRNGAGRNPNQLLPYFIMDRLGQYHGIPGLFVAVLFSGALSSISSSLNSLAAVTWKGLFEWRLKHIPEARKALATKVLAAVYGILGIIFAFLTQGFPGHVAQAFISFVNGVSGPLVGIFLMAALFPFTNWVGAIVGGFVGLGFTMWLAIGSYIARPHRAMLNTSVELCYRYTNRTPSPVPTNPPEGQVFPLYRLSFMWYAAVGTFSCLVVGLLVSLLSGPEKPSEQNPHYIIPFFDRLFSCFPKSCRRVLWCGVRHDDPPPLEHEQEADEAVEGGAEIWTTTKDGLYHRRWTGYDSVESVPNYVPVTGLSGSNEDTFTSHELKNTTYERLDSVPSYVPATGIPELSPGVSNAGEDNRAFEEDNINVTYL